MRQVRILIWAALVVGGLAVFALYRLGDQKQSQAQGELGRVPAFALTDQLGKPFGSAQLAGRPWIANFVFTRCPSVCPLLTAKFKSLQSKLTDVPDVQFVSFSVDPEHDTPPVLNEYAQKYDAGPSWHFLTGPLDTIEKTVVSGFKIHIGDPKPSENDPTLVEIMHGEHFVLVDAKGTIRGYYRAEPAELTQLAEDLRAMAKERLATR
ncbi:MAG TPA: SCO family protein [Polyangiales bacterium]|nr:SCO family protein [Polyangiales bacterium]